MLRIPILGILRFGAHFTIAQLCAVSHNIIAWKFASKDETTRYELFPKVDEAKFDVEGLHD